MNEQVKYDWMVYVICATYNHASYIKDAMNGFTMQETDFPFVCAIIDDASTDGEQEVIKSYLNEHFDLEDRKVVRREETDDYVLTFARHKTNLNCYFAVLFLKYNHYSLKKTKAQYLAQWQNNAKYIAICEGDDYWIDPCKIQRQIQFLEDNIDFNLCTHRFWVKDERKFDSTGYEEFEYDKKAIMSSFRSYRGYVFDKRNYWENWTTQPLSCVYRNGDYLKEIPSKAFKYYRDTIKYYYIIKQGKGLLLEDRMGVYRMNNGGIFAGTNTSRNALVTYDSLSTLYRLEKDSSVFRELNRVIWSIACLNNKEKKINGLRVIFDHYKTLTIRDRIYFSMFLLKNMTTILFARIKK